MSTLQTICDSIASLKILTLRDDCFRVEFGANTLAEWCCLQNLAYPVDGFKKVFDIVGPESDFILFDNELEDISPAPQYESRLITRGFILYFSYADKDVNGEDVEDIDKNLGVTIWDSSNNSFTIPVYQFFSLLSNPVTDVKTQLINKIEIVNSNNFDVTVSGLLLLGSRDGVSMEGSITESC